MPDTKRKIDSIFLVSARNNNRMQGDVGIALVLFKHVVIFAHAIECSDEDVAVASSGKNESFGRHLARFNFGNV